MTNAGGQSAESSSSTMNPTEVVAGSTSWRGPLSSVNSAYSRASNDDSRGCAAVAWCGQRARSGSAIPTPTVTAVAREAFPTYVQQFNAIGCVPPGEKPLTMGVTARACVGR